MNIPIRQPAAAAAVFTTNLVQAAPVQLSRQRLAKTGGEAAAILVNAGNANCATRTGTRRTVYASPGGFNPTCRQDRVSRCGLRRRRYRWP